MSNVNNSKRLKITVAYVSMSDYIHYVNSYTFLSDYSRLAHYHN